MSDQSTMQTELDTISNEIPSFVTATSLASTLAGYLTSASLSAYLTATDLATALTDYVTTSQLITTVSYLASKTTVDNNYLAFTNAVTTIDAAIADCVTTAELASLEVTYDGEFLANGTAINANATAITAL